MRAGMGGALMLAAVAAGAQAQDVPGLRRVGNPGVHIGIAGLLAQPTGQFSNFVGFGGGLGAHVAWEPEAGGLFGLRVDGSYLIYGSETRRYGLLPLVDVDVTTHNQIAGLQLGPQVSVGRGPVRAYGFGQVGFSYFATTSSAEGSGNIGDFASTTNFDDFTLATAVGGGLRFQLSRGRTPVALDLGARYLYNGRVRYLTEESIAVTETDVIVTPIESQANLILYHVGITIGLR
jgi:hypothetical protein